MWLDECGCVLNLAISSTKETLESVEDFYEEDFGEPPNGSDYCY